MKLMPFFYITDENRYPYFDGKWGKIGQNRTKTQNEVDKFRGNDLNLAKILRNKHSEFTKEETLN